MDTQPVEAVYFDVRKPGATAESSDTQMAEEHLGTVQGRTPTTSHAMDSRNVTIAHGLAPIGAQESDRPGDEKPEADKRNLTESHAVAHTVPQNQPTQESDKPGDERPTAAEARDVAESHTTSAPSAHEEHRKAMEDQKVLDKEALSKFSRPEDIPTEQLPNYKTRMCPFTIAGEVCPYNDQCSFAHSEEEKRESPFLKTKLCRRGLGCPHKDTCRFAHTEAELRPMPQREIARCAHTKSRRILVDGEIVEVDPSQMPSIRMPSHIYQREKEKERMAMLAARGYGHGGYAPRGRARGHGGEYGYGRGGGYGDGGYGYGGYGRGGGGYGDAGYGRGRGGYGQQYYPRGGGRGGSYYNAHYDHEYDDGYDHHHGYGHFEVEADWQEEQQYYAPGRGFQQRTAPPRGRGFAPSNGRGRGQDYGGLNVNSRPFIPGHGDDDAYYNDYAEEEEDYPVEVRYVSQDGEPIPHALMARPRGGRGYRGGPPETVVVVVKQQ